MMIEIENIVTSLSLSLSLSLASQTSVHVQEVKINPKNQSDTKLIREIRFLFGV